MDGRSSKMRKATLSTWSKFFSLHLTWNMCRVTPLPLCSHLEQMVSLLDPRLLTDVAYDFPNHVGMKRYPCVRNHFRTLVKASYVLKDVDLSHKVAVVTGANSGLGEPAMGWGNNITCLCFKWAGFQTALELALCGAHVILACRDPVRGDLAAGRILERKVRGLLVLCRKGDGLCPFKKSRKSPEAGDWEGEEEGPC